MPLMFLCRHHLIPSRTILLRILPKVWKLALSFWRTDGSLCVRLTARERTVSMKSTLEIEEQLAALKEMTAMQLRARYAELFGEA